MSDTENKAPGPSPLDNLEAPTADVAEAQRKGFAAHLSAQKGFHDAADELADLGANSSKEGAQVGAPTEPRAPSPVSGSTKRGLGAPPRVAGDPADQLARGLSEPQAPEIGVRRQTRRLDEAETSVASHAPDAHSSESRSPRRYWAVAILLAGLGILLLVAILPNTGDDERARDDDGSVATATPGTAATVSSQPDVKTAAPPTAPTNSTAPDAATTSAPTPSSSARGKPSGERPGARTAAPRSSGEFDDWKLRR